MSGDEAEPLVVTPELDNILEAWVALAQNIEGFRMSVTLTVAGATVSGDLIGRNDWLDRFKEALAARAVEPDLPEGDQVDLSPLNELVEGWKHPIDKSVDAPPARFGYFHLINARFISGSGSVPTDQPGVEGMIYRGRISEVSGWALGKIGSST